MLCVQKFNASLSRVQGFKGSRLRVQKFNSSKIPKSTNVILELLKAAGI